MKTAIIGGLLIASTFSLNAQKTEGPVTLHIKKVEKINGVVKTLDTTYTTNDPEEIRRLMAEDKNFPGTDATGKKFSKHIIQSEETKTEEGKTCMKVIKMMDGTDDVSEDELRLSGIDPMVMGEKRIFITEEAFNKEDGSGVVRKKVVIKKIEISKPNKEEMNKYGKTNGNAKNLLPIETIEFFPNPGNGRFLLSFELPHKGLTEVKIISVEGKVVYSEKLADFSGSYKKEIDISQNPKGVYFISISQAEQSSLKKLIIE
jgi:hypothetical protein